MLTTNEDMSSVLARAKRFKKPPRHPDGLIPLDPMIANSPTVLKVLAEIMKIPNTTRAEAEDTIMRGTNLGEILTPEELAQRLKVTVEWVMEKRRPRCPNPIPALPIGKLIRFDWDSVVRWLEECAAADTKSLQQRRTGHVPQRRKAKNVITFPATNEEKNETATPDRKHRKA